MNIQKYISVVFIFICTNTVFAQQEQFLSNYWLNLEQLNPGVIASREASTAKVSYRTQWVGLEGAPSMATVFLEGASRLGKSKHHHGGALTLRHSSAGLVNRTGVYGGYAFQLAISKNSFVSAGINIGVVSFGENNADIRVTDPNDPDAFAGASNSKLDGSAGIWFHNQTWFAGISSTQIIGGQANFLTPADMVRNIHIVAGKKIDIGDASITPSIWAQGGPFGWNINVGAQMLYQDKLMGGGYYRINGDFSANIGVFFSENMYFSYAFSYPTNQISLISATSHEVTIGYRMSIYAKIQEKPYY